MAPEFKLSTSRSVVSGLVGGLYIIERVRFIPGHSFWRCGQGSHVLASYRQLCCHGELVDLEDVSRITFENALYHFRLICDSKQASLRFTLFRVFPLASLDTVVVVIINW